MELHHIPLDQLKISRFNMRHGRKAPDLADILPSIRARGIQQPLLVRRADDGYEIVAGRRRYFAAKTLATEGAEIGPIPCAIMQDGDDAAALEASLIENIARLDPDEMSRYETFARLVKQGRDVPGIAATFGLSEQAVRRALALGNLLPAIRKAYAAEEIDAATIRPLTMASEAQQRQWLALFADPEQHAPRGWQLKQWLFGAEISTKAALFPLELYTGRIVQDLFAEDSYFDDPAQFWSLQNQAVAAKRDALLQAGWREVVLLDPGERFQSWEHARATKKEGGRVYIERRENGEVTIHQGYLTAKEHRRRINGHEAEESLPPAEPRRELTSAAQNYLELHRHAAVRHALLAQTGLALRLIAAHVICGSRLWRVEPDPQRADKAEIAQSLAASKSESAFAEARSEILALLGLPEDRPFIVDGRGGDAEALRLLQTLLPLPDETVLRVLTFLMAETLEAGGAMVEALGTHLAVDMRDCWQPDEAFFALIRDKAAINAMLEEVGGAVTANANVTETAKTQKQIIRNYLTGDGREKIEAWLPRYMKFPFESYTSGGGGRLSETATLVAEHSRATTP
jgi:ParB family chromosome partitioning protein